MPTSNDYADKLEAAVKLAIHDLVEEECKNIIEGAKEKLTRKVAEITAAVSIEVMGRVSFEKLAHELLIHVQMDSPNVYKDVRG